MADIQLTEMRVIDGAMAGNCHKIDPRNATREDYAAMLEASIQARRATAISAIPRATGIVNIQS